MAETFDFTTCPNCGAPLAIRSSERVLGSATVVAETIDGVPIARFDGETEVDWNSSETLDYYCDECKEPLPRAWQDMLDRLLGNVR